MNLISWNVPWQLRATPHERIAFLAAPERPDVVALQEVRDFDAYDSELTRIGLPHHCRLRLANGLGLLVGARWSLKSMGSTKFRIPDEESHFYRNPAAVGEVELPMLSLKVGREERPFELHVVHVPHGSGGGWRKIDTFRGVYARLATPCEIPRILCGDFNEPHTETNDGVLTWATKNRYARKDPEKWKAAVESVLSGLGAFDLVDVFRKCHVDDLCELSSFEIGKSTHRYDHIFASTSLGVVRAEYLPLDRKLSDHRAAVAEFSG